MSQNGKGDRNRIADRKKFRENMDAIFGKPKKATKKDTKRTVNKSNKSNKSKKVNK